MKHPKKTLLHSDIVRIHQVHIAQDKDTPVPDKLTYLLIPKSHHPTPIVEYRAKLHTDEVEELKGILVTPIVELYETSVSTISKDLDVQYVEIDHDGYHYLMTLGYVLYLDDNGKVDDVVSKMFPDLIQTDQTWVSKDLYPMPIGGFEFEAEQAILDYLDLHDLEIPDSLT